MECINGLPGVEDQKRTDGDVSEAKQGDDHFHGTDSFGYWVVSQKLRRLYVCRYSYSCQGVAMLLTTTTRQDYLIKVILF